MGSTARDIRLKNLFGMPHCTALHRLCKMVMLNQLRKHNEDVCFKCSKPIETPEELSIEHKIPWEGKSIELFWDLNNIAFSHLRCNTPHKRSGGATTNVRKVGPSGTNWCCKCRKFEPISVFMKDKSRWSGLSHKCSARLKLNSLTVDMVVHGDCSPGG